MGRQQQPANLLNGGVAKRGAFEHAICRVPGCGGSLRFVKGEFGRVLDICTRCEDRCAKVPALEAQLRATSARVDALIAAHGQPWRPGLCVHCRRPTPTVRVGRTPIYCTTESCIRMRKHDVREGKAPMRSARGMGAAR